MRLPFPGSTKKTRQQRLKVESNQRASCLHSFHCLLSESRKIIHRWSAIIVQGQLQAGEQRALEQFRGRGPGPRRGRAPPDEGPDLWVLHLPHGHKHCSGRHLPVDLGIADALAVWDLEGFLFGQMMPNRELCLV